MGQLANFRHLPIDWEMTPEEAVILYLEWGNNWRKDKGCPIRSKNEVSYYFVINNWENRPVVSLLKRNSEAVEELANLNLPKELESEYAYENGTPRGIYPIDKEVKIWLETELESNCYP